MRLAINQATTKNWSLAEVSAGCQRAGITELGVWRDSVAAVGVDEAVRILDSCGVRPISLCRGGFFTTDADWLDENRRAIDETAALHAGVLVLVCGGMPSGSRDLSGARSLVREAIGSLVPYAAERDVQLAIEPMHPMFCGDRGVVSTLGQAVDLASEFPAATVGVVVDTYHIWWDPQVYSSIARAAGRIALVQVSDWVTPLPAGALLGRGHVGDGCIDNRALVRAAYDAGYTGPVEVEIFNEAVWATPGDETLRTVVERHAEHIANG